MSVAALLAHPITVQEAWNRRDQGLVDAEVAVRGWGWAPDGVFDCNLPPDVPAIFAACQNSMTWLAADPRTRRNGVLQEPIGVALNVVLQPGTSGPTFSSGSPSDVIALGHFADHRAGRCPISGLVDRATCEQAFVVDALVNPVSPVLDVMPFGQPIGEPDPDAHPVLARGEAIVAAGLEPTSERLLIAFAMRRLEIDRSEPGAAEAIASAGVDVAWIVRFLDEDEGHAVIRTRIVSEKQTYHERKVLVWNVTRDGVLPIVPPTFPSVPPDDAFASAPHEVAGIVSRTVQMAIDRHYPADDSEILVRGWYVPHDPSATCPGGLDAPIRPVLPTCNEGANWLLDLPEQLWSDPTKVGIDRLPTGKSLNPIIPSDVPFDIPPLWRDGTPTPLAVVVLGHFTDPRVQTYAGDRYFVIDQLVWTSATGMVAQPDVVRLTADATETPEAVLDRVEAELGPSTTTWVSALSPSDLLIQDPDAIKRAPELFDANAVWVVRRLVDRPYDSVVRRIVGTAFTADGGDRIFSRAASSVQLATTIDVRPSGTDTRLIEIYDHPNIVVSARTPRATEQFDWRSIGPEDAAILFEIAAGSTDRELAIRWSGRTCQKDWRVEVLLGEDPEAGPTVYADARDWECTGDRIRRGMVLTLDRPIDLDTVRTNENTSGG